MTKKLCVLDVDETAIEWDYSRRGTSLSPRTGIYELLDFLKSNNIDVALFSTASISYVRRVQKEYFNDYEFVSLRGGESVTFFENEKVKDLSWYVTHMGYELEKIVLIDDKPRNARLYPKNYIRVRTPGFYSGSDKFDSGLLRAVKKLEIFFDTNKKDSP